MLALTIIFLAGLVIGGGCLSVYIAARVPLSVIRDLLAAFGWFIYQLVQLVCVCLVCLSLSIFYASTITAGLLIGLAVFVVYVIGGWFVIRKTVNGAE